MCYLSYRTTTPSNQRSNMHGGGTRHKDSRAKACPCIPLFVLLSSFPMAQNSKKSPCIPTFVSKRILFLLARNSSREERGFVSARNSALSFLQFLARMPTTLNRNR